MRRFLTLCLIAMASARGYNYAPLSGGSLASGGRGNGLSSGGLSSGASLSGGVSSSGSSSGGFSAPTQTITELNKEFYTYSAPEEQVHSGSNQQSSTTKLKKNLRVVFVKTPDDNGAVNAVLNVAKQISEDQTAIYVLVKESDGSEITQQLQQVSKHRSHKPEVRFVKYRTAQDAINAQRSIQAQYDTIGGSSRSSNEGDAPVLDYASKAPVSNNVLGSSSQLSGNVAAPSGSGSASISSPHSSYLPPAVV